MLKVLHTITKNKLVDSATDLTPEIKLLRDEVVNEALEMGYNPSNFTFCPTFSYEELENNKIKLIFKLEIMEYKEQ